MVWLSADEINVMLKTHCESLPNNCHIAYWVMLFGVLDRAKSKR